MQTGLKHKCASVVTEQDLAANVGSGGLRVYATPMMAALMERTCMECVQPHLDEGCGTVGTHIDIEHTAPTPLGMSVECECELTSIEGRKLSFSVKVSDENGTIGTGTHERFIIFNEKFQAKADKKNDIICTELHHDSTNAPLAEKLYFTAFPEIERHTTDELYNASKQESKTGCKWLVFTLQETFIGMAYMIIYKKIAFLLYFATEERQRNKRYGAKILNCLKSLFPNQDIVLLIESLYEKADNMDIRRRRKGFYLRNGLNDTGHIQTCQSGAIYDILSSAKEFSKGEYQDFISHYPFDNCMSEIFNSPEDFLKRNYEN